MTLRAKVASMVGARKKKLPKAVKIPKFVVKKPKVILNFARNVDNEIASEHDDNIL